MSFIVAVGLLASVIILFIVVLKCCLRRYELSSYQNQQSQTLSTQTTRLPYNPDPLQSSNYFPTAPNQMYSTRPSNFNQPIQSGTLPPAIMGFGQNTAVLGTHGSIRQYPVQWPNQAFSGPGIQSPINPNVTHSVPDLPPSYVVASELLDPPPSYIEALKSPR